MKTALLLAAALAFTGAAAAQTKPDTRSDYLRSESVKREAKPGRVGAVLDLNTATEKDLAALPGIGEAGAKAIVKGRPYRQKSELLRRKILADDVYKKVEDILVVRSTATTVPRGREAPGG
jgi:competence protein ComEA